MMSLGATSLSVDGSTITVHLKNHHHSSWSVLFSYAAGDAATVPPPPLPANRLYINLFLSLSLCLAYLFPHVIAVLLVLLTDLLVHFYCMTLNWTSIITLATHTWQPS